jgi:predicted RNase H-like HicB family nuclease
MKIRYEMIIYWSNEDQLFIFEFQELAGCMADVENYQEAVKNAEEVLESLIQLYQKLGESLPHPEITKKGEILLKIN